MFNNVTPEPRRRASTSFRERNGPMRPTQPYSISLPGEEEIEQKIFELWPLRGPKGKHGRTKKASKIFALAAASDRQTSNHHHHHPVISLLP